MCFMRCADEIRVCFSETNTSSTQRSRFSIVVQYDPPVAFAVEQRVHVQLALEAEVEQEQCSAM